MTIETLHFQHYFYQKYLQSTSTTKRVTYWVRLDQDIERHRLMYALLDVVQHQPQLRATFKHCNDQLRINVRESTIIYIYEISNEGQLIPNSEQKVYGIKELSRTGIKSKFSDDYTEANLWDIQAYISSGLPFKNKFVLTKNPFTFEEQLNWKYLNKSTSLHPSPKGEGPPFGEGDKNEENLKLKGVWVYDYNSLNFIEYFNSVKSCQDKYQIPSTTFKRIRKHKLNFKGYLFSNCDLNITKTPDT